ATAALAELVQQLEVRPLHAWVAATNGGSNPGLRKSGLLRARGDTPRGGGAHRSETPPGTWRSICTNSPERGRTTGHVVLRPALRVAQAPAAATGVRRARRLLPLLRRAADACRGHADTAA